MGGIDHRTPPWIVYDGEVVVERIGKIIDVEIPNPRRLQPKGSIRRVPRFMAGVKKVTQLDDTHVHWHAEILGMDKEWDAEITEQVPDERIAWKSISCDAPKPVGCDLRP